VSAHTRALPVPEWWRPDTPAGARAPAARGRAAFGALVAYTIVLVAAPQEFVAGLAPLRLGLLAAVAALGAYLLDRWRGRARTPPWPRELLCVVGLLGWAALTLPFSFWPSGSVGVIVNLYLKSIAVFVLLAGVVDSLPRLRMLLGVLAACAAVIALTAVRHFVMGTLMAGTGNRIAGYGSTSMAGNPNDLALLLNIVIPLAAALVAVGQTMLRRVAAALVLLLCIAGVIVTFSRAGFITLAVMGLMGIGLLLKRRAAAWILVIGIGAIGVAAVLPSKYLDRLSTVWNVDADRTGSAQDRWRDTVAAASFAIRHPLIGVGIGMDYLALNKERGATWLSVHNAYLNYAVDLGAPGLLLFLAMLGSAWGGTKTAERHAARAPARPALATIATAVRVSLTGFAVAAFFHPIAYHAFFYYVAGLAVAVRNVDHLTEAT
jgi:O-antigen ligase